MKFLSLLLVLTVTFVACNKSDGVIENPPPPPPPPLEKMRVMQSIRNYIDNNILVADTTTFEYDSQGRVTKKISSHGYVEIYTYNGDKIMSMKSTASGNETEILREAIYSSDGDSILIDFHPNSTATDTVQLTYIFNDSIQTDFWTYLHFTGGCMCTERHLQKEKYYYNTQGNLIKTTMQTLSDAEEGDMAIVTAWDDKINPKRSQPKINTLLLGLNMPLESGSLHNPTSYTLGGTDYEVEMTYNTEGYPLTFKMKDKDYISTKLVYNR